MNGPTGDRAGQAWLLMAPALALLGLCFLVPLGYVLVMSVSYPGWGMQNYGRLATSPVFARVLWETFRTAFVVTGCSLLLAYPLAYVAANGPRWLTNLILAALLLSFWTSFLVRTFAWIVILGANGPVSGMMSAIGWAPAPKLLYTSFSATLAMTHSLIPFMAQALYAVMRRIDRQNLRAAENQDPTPLRAFVHVYLPLSAPGIVNGCTLVFITCLGFYVMPVLLGSPQTRIISGIIGDQIDQSLNFGLAAAISVVLLVITVAVYALYDRIFGLDRLWGGAAA